MRKAVYAIIVSFLLIFMTALASVAGMITPRLQSALESIGPDEEVSAIVTLTDRVDLKLFRDKDKALRRARLIRALRGKADSTQAPLIALLRQKKAKHALSLWLVNGMAVTATADAVRELAAHPLVAKVELDYAIPLAEAVYGAPTEVEWNIRAIRANELWALGYGGRGVVVASMDSGVDINHADLTDRWRGGTNSWYDPNGEHNAPYDANGHGTQTMGIMVGGDAGGSAIGVAPDAKWIAVKIFNDADQAPLSAIHQGYQWLLDPDGNPETNDAADIVNNSWGFGLNPDQCIDEFRPDIQALRTAEIAVVFSAGNNGPYDASSISPANYPESFAVGAVDDASAIARFSSRGPSTCDGSTYPEVVAPGVNVRTSDITFEGALPYLYGYVSGTSFAAPHVSGAMALLLSAFPGLRVTELEVALRESATDLGLEGPDNDYGFGLVDVMDAYSLVSENPVLCTDGDDDGFYAEAGCGTAQQDCDDNDPAIYPEAPEVKHDGIDQDCNGYDLTIDIIKAAYGAKKDTLSVEATSALNKSAGLELVDYGAMKWNRKKQNWAISVRGAGGDPGTVTVSGIEGSETAQTTAK